MNISKAEGREPAFAKASADKAGSGWNKETDPEGVEY
jgi:hypothetical protein